MSSQMKVLLLEDEDRVCKEFENVCKNNNDINIIRTTKSSIEALNLVKKYKYDGIIVDLELHFGTGSGFDFLEELAKLNIEPKPIVIVNTNIISQIVYDKLHNGLADIIFYKKQDGYSPKNVIDRLVSFAKTSTRESNMLHINEEDKEKMIEDLINEELDLIGINYKLKGRKYLFDAILYTIQGKEKETNITAIQYIASKTALLTNSISRAMQTAINEAWRNSPIEDLKEHYTAKINYNTGVPTPTEFICFYDEKIRKMIEIH